MKLIERDDLLRQVHQAVVGIKGNPDENGLIGIVKDMDKKLDLLNGRVRGNEVRSKVNQGLLGSIGGGGILGLLGKLWGWW